MKSARNRPLKKLARRQAVRKAEVKLPKWSLALMERQLDREIAAWARKLLLVIDGDVRKLTEEQVQWLVERSKSRPKRVRRMVNARTQNKSARQR